MSQQNETKQNERMVCWKLFENEVEYRLERQWEWGCADIKNGSVVGSI